MTKNTKSNSDNIDSLIIEPRPSQWFTDEPIEPLYIVLHCSGYNNTLDVFDKSKVSCHYFIPEQNETDPLLVYEVVKLPLRAWHAGISHWKNDSNLNAYAIGIEINMPNYAHALENKTLDFLYFENFQEKQIKALQILVNQLQQQYNIPAENVVGHADIAAWRNISGETIMSRTDPGPTFPWKILAKNGIGLWPEGDCPETIKKNLTAIQAQGLLRAVGYNVPLTGEFDTETNLTMGAARLHFEPNCFNQTSGSAHACYEKSFDSNLACSLYALNSHHAPESNVSSSSTLFLLLAFGSPTLLLLFFLGCLLYRRYTQTSSEEKVNERTSLLSKFSHFSPDHSTQSATKNESYQASLCSIF